MRHCIELRSGGRKRLRGVRGVHGSCCGATNGGCDGLGESLVETPGSAGCHEGLGRTLPRGPGLRFLRNGRLCCQRNRVSARLVYIEYSFLVGCSARSKIAEKNDERRGSGMAAMRDAAARAGARAVARIAVRAALL